MKKFIWLIAFVSLFALGQAMVPVTQAQTDDNVTIVKINGDGAFNIPTDQIGTLSGLAYEALDGPFAAGNQAIVDELNKNVLVTSINLDNLASTLKLGPGVYAFTITGSDDTAKVTYFILPNNLTRTTLVSR